MKHSFFFIILFLVSLTGVAQQDPAAKEILDRVAEKNKQYKSIQANFELIIENRREDQTSGSSGIIKIKGEKYYMESMGTKVFYNGTTLWSYMEDINEVTISEPDQESDDIIENPVKIFDFYNRDFKYHLIGEGCMKSIYFQIIFNNPIRDLKFLLNAIMKNYLCLKLWEKMVSITKQS